MRLSRVSSRLRRWRWLVSGQVQGVGFRPFLYRTARALNLDGFVRNSDEGVIIECQGSSAALALFHAEVVNNPPPLADVRRIQMQIIETMAAPRGFRIERSHDQQSHTAIDADITVDAATCPECKSEILSPHQRRRGYGLTNCTQCGPRYSIIRRIPYDRMNTTMAQFSMCPSCESEYTNPADRRFHAQPIACHECGPTVELVDSNGRPISGDPIENAQKLLLGGKILAIKGLGGFHLAVRADDEQAVKRLQQLKRRDHKPFALMVPSIEAARQVVILSATAETLMQSPACPIVLASRRDGAGVAEGVAPCSDRLGVMLPYTPIQHLLMVAVPTLVMTSGNVSEEPLAIDNDDALRRLGPMCDAILWHDRPIQRGVDDSVVIDVPSGGDPIPIRRARGFVPRAIELPISAASNGICLGGELKNTIAVVRGDTAILSQHLGDLTHPRACEAFLQTIDDLQALFAVRPAWIARDLHPTYTSTRIAQKLAAQLSVPCIPIQHHHAHAAALMAEHGITAPILAIVCDGTGYGTDGTIWGGELLLANLRDFRRLAHLRPLRLPGGDAAARDTTRCAMALLHQAHPDSFDSHPITQRLVPDVERREFLGRMIRGKVACAISSGAGRYFDGVAALLGLAKCNHFEAQAAMALETAARRSKRCHTEDLFEFSGGVTRGINLAPLTRHLLTSLDRDAAADDLAALFHEQFARAWAAAVVEQSKSLDVRIVGLTGGVFCNVILTQRLTELLESRGLRVLRHRIVPPNDGGLSLGQAAIASALSA